MFSPTIENNKEIKLKPLNLKQDLFCKLYATDSSVIGNATRAYMLAYGQESEINARVASTMMIAKPHIRAKINEYISKDGFNDESVDKKHNFLIHQFKDFNVSLKAIQEYNKLKKRVDNKIEIVLPKPIMELENDEVIHKIDKGKAKVIDDNGV